MRKTPPPTAGSQTRNRSGGPSNGESATSTIFCAISGGVATTPGLRMQTSEAGIPLRRRSLQPADVVEHRLRVRGHVGDLVDLHDGPAGVDEVREAARVRRPG